MRHMQTVSGEVAKKESDSATHQHVEPRTQSKRNRAQVKGHSHHTTTFEKFTTQVQHLYYAIENSYTSTYERNRAHMKNNTRSHP